MSLNWQRQGNHLLLIWEGAAPRRRSVIVGLIVGSKDGQRHRLYFRHRLGSSPPPPPEVLV